jgi:hypothetical protein
MMGKISLNDHVSWPRSPSVVERERERERNRHWSERVLGVRPYIANPNTLDMSNGPRLENFSRWSTGRTCPMAIRHIQQTNN